MNETLILAQEALLEKNYKRAIECFSHLLCQPDCEASSKALLYLSRSTCYFELCNYEESCQDAKQVLELEEIYSEESIFPGIHSTFVAAAFRLYKVNEAQGNIHKADAYKRMMEDFSKTFKKNPEKATSIKKTGNDLFTQGQIHEAIKKYHEALQYNPSDETIHSNLSQGYLMLKELDKAQLYSDKCTELKPNWSKGWYRSGKVLMQRENYIDACHAFEKGFQIDPENSELKRSYIECAHFAKRLGNGDPGYDSRTIGMLMTIQQSSWNVEAWLKENKQTRSYMSLDALDNLILPYIQSKDILNTIETTMQARYMHYKSWTFPCLLDSQTKLNLLNMESPLPVLNYILPFDPFLSAAILLAFLEKAQPTTEYYVAFTFDANPEYFKNMQLESFIQSHGKYAVLVCPEGNGTIIDFMSLYESLLDKKAPKWNFDERQLPSLLNKDGWFYTLHGREAFLECLEGIYTRERKKDEALEAIKSSYALGSALRKGQSKSSESINTLTNEEPQLFKPPVEEETPMDKEIASMKKQVYQEQQQEPVVHPTLVKVEPQKNDYLSRLLYISLFAAIAALGFSLGMASKH